MPKLVCKNCKQYCYCSIKKEGNLSQIYRCSECQTDFEDDNPTWSDVKAVGKVFQLVGSIAFLAVGVSTGIPTGSGDMPMSSTFS
jgi:hypothetical protein